MVRQSFRSNLGETDPQKILAHKEAAIRGLGNFMFHEAQVLTKVSVALSPRPVTPPFPPWARPAPPPPPPPPAMTPPSTVLLGS